MSSLFISHSSQDDAFVRDLREALEYHDVEAWIDSRELRGGDSLPAEIRQAIEDVDAFAVVVSTDSLQSRWVGKELRHALDVCKQRGKDRYRVIPLSLNGTRLGVLEEFFDGEPLYIPVNKADGIEAAIHPVLVALGRRLPSDVAAEPQPKAEPLEELVLELTDLKFHEKDNVRRPSAKARLVYEPATERQRNVDSARAWRWIAPVGPIEAAELRWYLEKYAIWPSGYFRERAQKVETNLVAMGKLLHDATFPVANVANILQAWARIDGTAERRFSVEVDASLEEGASPAEVEAARECATLLLGLPWELLHDGERFLFEGGQAVRVRRRLPNTRVLDVPVMATPIRILLVTARPEDESCAYIDHRASALPLVEAMETLGGLVRIRVLSPPTLSALGEELDRARRAGAPYHVLHFDGHGVYNKNQGLGALCFEDPQDVEKLEGRRHLTVDTNTLGPLLSDHRIPLVFLEACQTAKAEQASESVASELLKVGVASVVAMSHSVLVETSRRFVEAFYDALAAGARVGDAMLRAQRELKNDTFRGRIFGAGELRLEDWFVPVLFQEKDDPQLFRTTTARTTGEDRAKALAARLGALPKEPETGFVGRSRELLALQRLLRQDGKARYAVLRGQGGEGKTALAAEFARWMVRSQQMRRAAFVSVETHSNAKAVLDAIGRQLVPSYSVATFKDLEAAILPVERALVEQPTLLVVDNMESVLLPPYVEASEALSEEARREAEAILALCERLHSKGDTRLLFTSREALPAPFDGARNRRELQRLDREDAVKLVERVLNREAAGAGAATDAAREEIELLVDAVHGHARTLQLLAPSLRGQGVAATRASLVELMEEMERKYPGSREQSLFASVELSLRRLSPANRERVGVLGLFQGVVDLDMLREMMKWEKANVDSLAEELIATGLATADPYGHLTLNPALCPYLRAQTDATERDRLALLWIEVMRSYAESLVRLRSQQTEVAATLTVLELPNLILLLDRTKDAGDAEATIDLTTTLHELLGLLGPPRLLEHVAKVRDSAAATLHQIHSHAWFEVQRTRIEQHYFEGRIGDALQAATALVEHAREVGPTAYPGADYDLAGACWLLGRALNGAGRAQEALSLLDEAQKRLETIHQNRPNCGADVAACLCLSERGTCLRILGQLDEAASTYEEAIRSAEKLGIERHLAVYKGELGTVRLLQNRFAEALTAYHEARQSFTSLDEPYEVATSLHMSGRVYEQLGEREAAEDAYRQALAIRVRLGGIAEQARTLVALGGLHDDQPEQAVPIYRQAIDKFMELGDEQGERIARSNLAIALRKLQRLDEARQQIHLTIEREARLGHAAEPWKSWATLANIEMAAGDPAAAAKAKRKASEAYFAYRNDGGENHYTDGRLALMVTEALQTGNAATAEAQLRRVAANPDVPPIFHPFLNALQAIVAGSRDRAFADDPDLHYTMAAEILLLIDTLESPPPGIY